MAMESTRANAWRPLRECFAPQYLAPFGKLYQNGRVDYEICIQVYVPPFIFGFGAYDLGQCSEKYKRSGLVELQKNYLMYVSLIYLTGKGIGAC